MRAMAPFAFVLAIGCGATAPAPTPAPTPPTLEGAWAGESQNASGTGFLFRGDGTVTWTLGQAFEIQYRADLSSTPAKLDLFGFQGGPLAGRTLNCIIDIAGERMRMDCEPGSYPAAFSDTQTQTFVRRP